MACECCLKSENLCVCQSIHPSLTRIHVLILQHPQEPDKDLGTAKLANLSLPNSTLRIGLSWPNLSKTLGADYKGSTDPHDWVVLYLGTAKQILPHSVSHKTGSQLILTNKKGQPISDPVETIKKIQGIIVLDGNWRQAKALWWRNPWMLKLNRVFLKPNKPSLYGRIRKEPRKECLSTIESIGVTLSALGENPSVQENLEKIFLKLLEKAKAQVNKEIEK